MAASDLRRVLVTLWSWYAPAQVRERFLVATAEDLPHACEEL